MGKLNKSDIKKIADLANLDVTDEDLKEYVPQLSQIVDYVSELEAVETEGIEPTSQTTGLVNTSRNDEINNERVLDISESISQTNKKVNNYFAVDMILKEKDLT